MCGIVGIKFFNEEPKKSDQKRVEEALKTQNHRGPDDTGILSTGNAVLGHNRLAIIDLNPRSNQPFIDETGRYSLIFNGEIYNYQHLKNDLLKKGVVFHTSSDTEVLLQHLIDQGEEGIKALRGCFSFAFYDKTEDALILARDQMGINPLLFAVENDSVLFASELTSFREMLSAWEIDHESLNYYFKFTYIPAPKTILRGVQKLLPGHYLKVKGKDLDFVRYFSPEMKLNTSLTYEEAVRTTREYVENAVIRRLEADVPVGTFLSGGLDSSIVSAVAADFKTDLNTYSVGFSESKFFDESEYAQKVAQHIGSNHHAVILDRKSVLYEMKNVLDSFDEPFADSSAIAMYFLSRAAREKLTVCLSGDGADELFAGYNKHKAYVKSLHVNPLMKTAAHVFGSFNTGNRNSRWNNKVRQASKFKQLLNEEWPGKYWFLSSFISDDSRNELLKIVNDPLSKLDLSDRSLNGFLLADQLFVLPNDMLKKVDIMSMRHSLEVRVPFLDVELVSFVNGIDQSFKLENGVGKRILRDAFKDLIPQEILNRSKKGFEVPLQVWLTEGWFDIVDKRWFDSSFIDDQKFFNKNAVQELKNKLFSSKPGESAIVIWAYIVFQNWYCRWTEK
ncbi:MAG: asparagine synthase (glutamine-hydrolyzing) [Brumimicrobium sp.]|nr:asparagine synthase (glutamine-hydrolyzing) [Brumimicrobium sp.]